MHVQCKYSTQTCIIVKKVLVCIFYGFGGIFTIGTSVPLIVYYMYHKILMHFFFFFFFFTILKCVRENVGRIATVQTLITQFYNGAVCSAYVLVAHTIP